MVRVVKMPGQEVARDGDAVGGRSAVSRVRLLAVSLASNTNPVARLDVRDKGPALQHATGDCVPICSGRCCLPRARGVVEAVSASSARVCWQLA